jgi:hypothetical protein
MLATGLLASGLLASMPASAEPFLQSTGARCGQPLRAWRPPAVGPAIATAIATARERFWNSRSRGIRAAPAGRRRQQRADAPLLRPPPLLARGIFADEERELYNLRIEKEGEARREVELLREEFVEETRNTANGQLCATPFGVDVVGITELIALIGALVGGVSARQRKQEVELLNEQLRKINITLRQQARAGTVYAPGAPQGAPHPPHSIGLGPRGCWGIHSSTDSSLRLLILRLLLPSPPLVPALRP